MIRRSTLTGLDPGSTVHFDVVASNDIQQNVDSGDNSFNTLQQVTGVAGLPVTVTDSGTLSSAQRSDDTTVDWGDGSTDTGAQIQCSDDGEDEHRLPTDRQPHLRLPRRLPDRRSRTPTSALTTDVIRRHLR